ncbi:MAG: putative Ig domain-containing protein [Gemmataceae bacterium]|nr:putative Ig domain-containing protein [Gemmataceae bacterium]
MESLEDRLAPAVGFPGTETISATLTADNHYGLYRGSADGSALTFIGRNETGYWGNPGTYNWSLPETYTFQASPGDYLYVLAWDDGGPQGWIGQFDLNGVPLYSDTSHWQYTVSAGANPGENGDVPALSAVAATIAGASWANPAATAANGSSPWGTIPGLSSNAQFVWHDTLGADSTSDGHYVIYRTSAPVVPANHPPTAGDDSAATTKNVPLDIAAATLLANDTDADNDALRVVSVSAASSQAGTASLNDNGTPANFSDDFVDYDPPTGFFGTDTFQYTIQDAFGWTATATVTVTVTSPDAITATLTADNHYGLYFGSADGSSLTFVGRNEVGAAGNPGTYNWSLPETHTFDPGVGNYIYVVVWDDGQQQMWAGQFDLPGGVTLVSDTRHWQYTVGGTNPGETGAVPALSELGSVIGSATWAMPGASAAQGTAPWGTIAGLSEDVQFVWPDTLGAGSSTDGHYVIFRTVAPVSPTNRSPDAGDDFAITNENTPLHLGVADVLANDSDGDGDALRVIAVTATSAQGGTVALNDNGTADPTDDFITYQPPTGFFDFDSFEYTIRDSFGWTATATVFVGVNSTTGVRATLTADNHYGLYFGAGDGSALTLVGRNETGAAGNPGAANWSLAETYDFHIETGDYLYVLVWDDGGPQMWTGQFELPNGVGLVSDLAHWQYAVAEGANPGPDGVLPSLAEVMSTVAAASWANPAASAANGDAPWGTIPGLSDDAQLVWHDTLGADSSSDGHYVIFRTALPVDQILMVQNPGPQANAEGAEVALQVLAGEPSNRTLVYSASGLPAGLSMDSATGLISGSIDYSAAQASGGSYGVTVSVTDGMSTVSRTFTWTISDTNRLVSPINQVDEEGESIQFVIRDRDASAVSRVYSVVGLPSGLSIGASTGVITGTLAFTAAEADSGIYTITVSVTSGGETDSETFTWTVLETNRLWRPDDQIHREGNAVALQLEVRSDAGSGLTYSAVGLPDGLSIDSATGLISGTIAASGSTTTTTTQVTIGVSGGGDTDTRTFAWIIVRGTAPQVFFVMNNTLRPDDDFALMDASATTQQPIPIGILLYAPDGVSHSVELTISPTLRGTIDVPAFPMQDGQRVTVLYTPQQESQAAADVFLQAKVDGQNQAGMAFGNVKIEFPKLVRAANTPALMPNRIPPRVDTLFSTTIGPGLKAGQAVWVRLAGDEQPANGSAKLVSGDGKAFRWLGFFDAGTYNRAVRGINQTEATGEDGGGNAGKLYLKVELWTDMKVVEQDFMRTPGFSVAAIPSGIEMKDPKPAPGVSLKVNNRQTYFWGTYYNYEVKSDSGVLADLDQVTMKEIIEKQSATGVVEQIFDTLSVGNWHKAETGQDLHAGGYAGKDAAEAAATFRKAIDTYVDKDKKPISAGALLQYFIFADKRTGLKQDDVNQTVIPNSGYKVVYVTAHRDDNKKYVIIIGKTGFKNNGADVGKISEADTKGQSTEIVAPAMK